MAYGRIPSLNWLRVFEAAARSQSFSAASRVLHMSPAAVSQQIKALETHLDTRLFERGPRSVTLTDAGRAFLPVVRQAVLSVETTAASLFGRAGGRVLDVQATLIFATAWLAPRLPAFEQAHTGIHVHLMGGYDDEPGRADPDLSIVFGGAPRAWGDSDLLFGEYLYPVATAAIAASIRTPADLLGHRLIEIATHRAGWLQLLEAELGTAVERARFRFTDTTQIALALAAAGYGIALARSPATDGAVAASGLQPCLEGFGLRGDEAYHLVCRSRRSLSPAARVFRDWLLEQAAACRQPAAATR